MFNKFKTIFLLALLITGFALLFSGDFIASSLLFAFIAVVSNIFLSEKMSNSKKMAN